ncbi:MAG: beta-propeller domain-containing protein [Alphaproteobacteria bacterium]|nr:beta-propeller domain-containing protein [Alphaproteobacteria bacterium]
MQIWENNEMAGLVGLRAAVVAVAVLIGVSAGFNMAQAAPGDDGRNAPRGTLTPFRSDQELQQFLQRVRKARRSRAVPAPAPAASEAPADAAAAPSQDKAAGESITNTQEAGVDEGGIVKVFGDYLVILRRGRLFTVSARQGDLRPIDSVEAYPPGADARGDWYDEMLISGNRVIVIGYSYSRGGTEINRFRIGNNGQLSFEDAYHLKSNDYYSSRNYASRLIGTQLIVYSPLYLPYGVESLDWLPGLRKWSGDPQAGFTRIVSAREIYVPRAVLDDEHADVDALHTVTTCDLASPVLRCRGVSVLGPNGRTFYVSGNAVYVWATQNRWWRNEDEDDRRAPSSMLFRMPLSGGAPSAIGVRGGPTDQFSFREDWREGVLNVLVRSNGGGDAMWRGEFSSGAVALLRLPLGSFSDGTQEAPWGRYRPLPRPSQESYTFQNRFVGDYVLYGSGNNWGRPQDRRTSLVMTPVRGGPVTQMPLSHGVDRIEAMGRDAVVVGSDTSDLHFQAIELTSGWQPRMGDRYTLERAAQGETRSHAFFYKPESQDMTEGVLALPVARAARPAHRQLAENSAAVIFLRRAQRQFAPLGELGAHEDGVVDDACKASCADWYGNARPIFLRGRTFALMGYEIVEGQLDRDSITETRRISFAPRAW